MVRNPDRCIACRVCERQCANEVHSIRRRKPSSCSATNRKCVNCQRCVSLCPTHALKIVKNDCTFRENANWQPRHHQRNLQAGRHSGGVLLSSMGNPKPLPVYWDRILINASQVTNPLHRPAARADGNQSVSRQKARPKSTAIPTAGSYPELPPQLELSMPVMFSAMSYGSISYNAHESLARAATGTGHLL